jgi:hypothetical protein
MSKLIPLTQGKSTIVDDEDYEMIIESGYKWLTSKSHGNYYALGFNNGDHMLMHRLILKPASGVNLDHKNRNGLDNRRANLRIATNGQNQANSKTRSKSGYRGAYKRKDCSSYQASITVNRKVIKLGNYSKVKDAARAYDKAAREAFGEFATLNFPMEEV